MLRMELEFSLSSAGDGDISSNNFINPSLNCSSVGNNILAMSVDIVYSNSNGSLTASALVEMAEEWMNGIRTANGVAFQINRSGASNSVRLHDDKHCHSDNQFTITIQFPRFSLWMLVNWWELSFYALSLYFSSLPSLS